MQPRKTQSIQTKRSDELKVLQRRFERAKEIIRNMQIPHPEEEVLEIKGFFDAYHALPNANPGLKNFTLMLEAYLLKPIAFGERENVLIGVKALNTHLQKELEEMTMPSGLRSIAKMLNTVLPDSKKLPVTPDPQLQTDMDINDNNLLEKTKNCLLTQVESFYEAGTGEYKAKPSMSTLKTMKSFPEKTAVESLLGRIKDVLSYSDSLEWYPDHDKNSNTTDLVNAKAFKSKTACEKAIQSLLENNITCSLEITKQERYQIRIPLNKNSSNKLEDKKDTVADTTDIESLKKKIEAILNNGNPLSWQITNGNLIWQQPFPVSFKEACERNINKLLDQNICCWLHNHNEKIYQVLFPINQEAYQGLLIPRKSTQKYDEECIENSENTSSVPRLK